jgi:hypothetical protein
MKKLKQLLGVKNSKKAPLGHMSTQQQSIINLREMEEMLTKKQVFLESQV